MPRTRIIYQNEAVYVGPSNITGANEDVLLNHNLLRHISEVQGVNYGINASRQDIVMLGRSSTIANPIVNPPSVEFSMSYYFSSFANERKMGFDVNYRTGNAPFLNDTFSQFLVSGFDDDRRILDKRNYYIAISREGNDVLDNFTGTVNPVTVNTVIDPESPTYDIITFQDCYLKSYSIRGAVNEFTTCGVDFVAESISFATSGSGIEVGVYDNFNREVTITGINAVIPKFTREVGAGVVQPGDITIDIINTSGTVPQSGFGFEFNDIKIQSFSCDIDIDRDQLRSITHKGVIDRPIKYPVAASLNIESLVGDVTSGDLLELMKEDNFYDVDINLYKSVNCTETKELNSALFFRKGLLQNVVFNEEIGSNKRVVFSFRTEIKPEDLSYGIFMSGAINTGTMDKILLESGAY